MGHPVDIMSEYFPDAATDTADQHNLFLASSPSARVRQNVASDSNTNSTSNNTASYSNHVSMWGDIFMFTMWTIIFSSMLIV